MNGAPHRDDLSGLRRTVRRRALGNLLLALLTAAKQSGGRLRVRPGDADSIFLHFSDVRTLVRAGGGLGFEPRDVLVALLCPPLWPFDRATSLQPVVLAPADLAHPNSDGHAYCLDLHGVSPERLPELLYDNLRLRSFRLDHCVDAAAAAFVRSRLDRLPVDSRPLLPEGALRNGRDGFRSVAASTRRDEEPARPAPGQLRVVDFVVGAFDVVLGGLSAPVFLRLAREGEGSVDEARAAYLRFADPRLRAARAGWIGGPGLVIERKDADRETLGREVLEIGHGLEALADEAIAQSFLRMQPPATQRPDPNG
jgi:hypothetical protein